MRASAAALALAVLALPAAAAPGDTEPAVARLNHAGYRERMHCTASLVGPQEVVTARHCVDGLAAEDLHVLLGYDRGAYAEHRRVASIHAAADHDIARLCLDDEAAASPLPSSAEPPAPGPVAARGYPASRAHAQDTRRCALTPIPGEPQAVLDCPLEPGMSGAPVVAGDGEAARVIAVVSASGEGRSLVVLLGALPDGGCGAPG